MSGKNRATQLNIFGLVDVLRHLNSCVKWSRLQSLLDVPLNDITFEVFSFFVLTGHHDTRFDLFGLPELAVFMQDRRVTKVENDSDLFYVETRCLAFFFACLVLKEKLIHVVQLVFSDCRPYFAAFLLCGSLL